LVIDAVDATQGPFKQTRCLLTARC